MAAKALDLFQERWLLGYDIGCTFGGTIDRSSLGPEFRKKKCRTCVNAFHGYSHNARCQQSNHPNNIIGMGIKDLETLERIFSLSNQLASITRYMSKYNRRIFIDMYFKQWDRDKYANLANMLHNNYRQALDIVTTDAEKLKLDLAVVGLTEAELEAYWNDQDAHFTNMGTQPAQDLQAVEYIALLQMLRDTE